MNTIRLITITLTVLFTGTNMAQNPYAKEKTKTEAYSPVVLSEVKPQAWLQEQINADLNGFTGNLYSLAPALFDKDDIYGQNRLTRKDRKRDLGNNPEGAEWEVQYLWWNSETQSNWLDGYIRSAFLVNDPLHLEQVKKRVEHILATQDKDGYIGIYDPDLRYNFTDENGELWSKATLYRALIAYYYFTGDKKVLNAVIRAVDNVMANYPVGNSHPFALEKSSGGVCHGLTFTDVLDQLYHITGDTEYWDYALFLYKDYSTHALMETDIQYENIINPNYKIKGHGVHTYEHLRSLLVAYYASGNPALGQALDTYLQRVDKLLTPSGGPVGDEWIGGRSAEATLTGYEYCSLQELFDAYCMLFQKEGDPHYAAQAEYLFFNAALGARHPQKSAIAYLKTDNSYQMTGSCNGFDDQQEHKNRYKYSPVHQDVAVCCVPNAGRITPYYVQNMYLRNKEGFVAALLGASTLTTKFGKADVSIEQQGDYPFDNRLSFEVRTSRPATFCLKIRKPEWSGKVEVTGIEYSEDDNYIIINRKWAGKQAFTLSFERTVEKHYINNEVYFTYGGLVLALPVQATEIQKKEYAPGFVDYEYIPEHLAVYREIGEAPSLKNGKFTIKLYNPVWQQVQEKTLCYMRETILRQITFSSEEP